MNKFESSIVATDETSMAGDEKVDKAFDKESFSSLDVDSQIESLNSFIGDVKEKEVSKELPMDEYLESFKDKYVFLKGEEAKNNVISYYKNKSLPFTLVNSYAITYKNKETGIFFGITHEQINECHRDSYGDIDNTEYNKFREKRKMSADVLLVEALHNGHNRFIKIWEHTSKYLKNPKFYGENKASPIHLEYIQEGFGNSGGGDIINIPEWQLNSLAKRANSGNTYKLKGWMTCISSQYAHELVHSHQDDEDGYDKPPSRTWMEALPQMAEFLYDPLHNYYRNEVFRDLANDVVNEEKLRIDKKWGSYAEACKNFVFPTLIYELNQHGLIKLPISAEDIPKVLANLPEYYTQLSELERDSILEKYIIIKYEDMLEIGKKYYEMTGMKDFEENKKKISQIW